MAFSITRSPFGSLPDGTPVELFRLASSEGLVAEITNYGGTIHTLNVPNRDGTLADVVLGYPSLEGYVRGRAHFGCLVGRYANRIAQGQFTLDGRVHQLHCNLPHVHLHGGQRGFDKYAWTVEELSDTDAARLVLSHVSPDGDEHYPGTLRVECTYEVTADQALALQFRAATDAPTVLNLTNHAYFNLAGEGPGTVEQHRVQILADRFTVVDADQIPTGELRDVQGTALDFRQPRALGERIESPEEQMRLGSGYDHNFVLNGYDPALQQAGQGAAAAPPFLAAVVTEPSSGRQLEVFTTEPGMQLYTSNSLREVGKSVYAPRAGFCLETQHFPDSPNHPHFPSTILRPGQTFRSSTVFRFRATTTA